MAGTVLAHKQSDLYTHLARGTLTCSRVLHRQEKALIYWCASNSLKEDMTDSVSGTRCRRQVQRAAGGGPGRGGGRCARRSACRVPGHAQGGGGAGTCARLAECGRRRPLPLHHRLLPAAGPRRQCLPAAQGARRFGTLSLLSFDAMWTAPCPLSFCNLQTFHGTLIPHPCDCYCLGNGTWTVAVMDSGSLCVCMAHVASLPQASLLGMCGELTNSFVPVTTVPC